MVELPSPVGRPYCAKVEGKLDELGLEYEHIGVSPFRSRRPAVTEVSGQSGVPALVDPDHDVAGLVECDDIVAYLERMYG